MKKSVIGALIAGGLVIACAAFVVVLLLFKLLWAWTVPDLLPGAVQQGLVAREISWLTAAKIALVVAVLSGLCGGGKGHAAGRQ